MLNGTPYTPSRTQTHWAHCFELAFKRPLPGWEVDLRSCWDDIVDENISMSVIMYAGRTLESRPAEWYDDAHLHNTNGLWALFIHNTPTQVEGWDQI